LAVFAQHRAAIVANAPAIRGKRRATTEQIVPGHSAGTIAHPSSGRLARRKFGEINRTCGRYGYAEQKANSNDRLHYGVRPSLFLGSGVNNDFQTENPAFCASHKDCQGIDVNRFIEPCLNALSHCVTEPPYCTAADT
jgi:hypothetical protein